MGTAILVTIDTEVYPLSAGWEKTGLKGDLERDVYGMTSSGHYGLVYQLDMFARYGVKAVFFVEGLFASCPHVGLEPLRTIVNTIYSYGQEIQLHLHPEWIPYLADCPVPFRGGMVRQYSEDEQCYLIATARDNLVKAGARVPVAFRAGDYAANESTLNALVKLGFQFDSSYNLPYLRGACGLSGLGPMWHASPAHGLWEVPISCFEDWPGHHRHCQLAACSMPELTSAIRSAVCRSWNTFTLVSHSFELITNRRSSRPVTPRPLVIKRFAELCAYLADQQPGVSTLHFGDLVLEQLEGAPIKGSVIRTAQRYAEQLTGRLHALLAQG